LGACLGGVWAASGRVRVALGPLYDPLRAKIRVRIPVGSLLEIRLH
jgi:hypothetical protein